MTDFLQAIQSGVDSALNREKNFLEIHNLFENLKDQLESFISEDLCIELKSLNQGFMGKNYFKDPSQLYTDKILRIVNNNGSLKGDLTKVFFDRDNGYPCTIIIDGDEYTAVEKKSLEENIRKLLSTPSIGFILYNLKKAP